MKFYLPSKIVFLALALGVFPSASGRADDITLRLYDVSGRMSAALQDLRRGTAYFRTAPEYGEMVQSLGLLQDRVQRVRRLASQPYGSAEFILQEKEAISNSFQRYRNSLENAGDRNRRENFRLYGDVRYMNDIAEHFRELIRDLDRVTDQLWEQERNVRPQQPYSSQYPQYENYHNVPPGVGTSNQYGQPPYVVPSPYTPQWQQTPVYPQSYPEAYPGGQYREDDRRRQQRDRDDDDDDDHDD